MLKITLADTDALYCSKPTSSHQTGVFLGSYSEVSNLFPSTNLKLCLKLEDILHNLVKHYVDGKSKSYYAKGKGDVPVVLDKTWLEKQVSDLEAAFAGRGTIVCEAGINVSTQNRTFLTGLASLRDGASILKLNNMLFSGDTLFIYKTGTIYNLRLHESSDLAGAEGDITRFGILELALSLFAKKRDNFKADVWPSFDDWVKDARQTFAAIDEHQIVALTFDYNHFVKFVFSSRQRTAFSKFDASQKAIVGKFLRDERTSPHSASWYLDPANKVPVEGIGVGIMFYFMMMVRPDEFATWSGMMDEGLFILGLRNDPKSDEPTVANYEKTKALQQIIMQKMHEMGIGKAADDNSPADYLTVNEFLWFVTANEKDIKEELMKKQLKKPTGETAPGTKKLSDVLSSKADDLMNRLVAALLTKPFAILAGASGTGKSRMAKKLAYMTCLDKDLQPSVDANGKRKPLENFIIVPVKPNWHDSSDLLGYRSSIKEKGYQTTPFINFIIKAHCFPNTPFIACLDEMNLAPVEHYFAEYLSASEGSIEDAESGKSVSYPLIEPALFDADVTNLQLDGYALPAETKELIERVGLVIPKNLFVVGTVNMDDSTDQISRKVLDRAMTIEMNDVNYSNLQNGNYEKLDTSSLLLEEGDIAKFSKREAYDPSKLDNDFRAMLDNIKGVFEGTPFALGYRFGIESTLYREALKKLPLKDETGAAVEYNKIAVDHMTLMKVLPRITGTVDERSELLSRLKAYFKDNLDDKGLSKTALARMEKAAKSNGGYLGFWP